MAFAQCIGQFQYYFEIAVPQFLLKEISPKELRHQSPCYDVGPGESGPLLKEVNAGAHIL